MSNIGEDCTNYPGISSLNDDGSCVTRFNYDFCLRAEDSGFLGKSQFSTRSQKGSKLDWILEFGPDMQLNLYLLGWKSYDDVKVHVICCWKMPFMEGEYTAINENLYSGLPLPILWSVPLPNFPDTNCISLSDCGVLLDISLQDGINHRAKRLGQRLTSVLENGLFSDVALEAGGSIFLAHRVILSQRCPAFWRSRGIAGDHIGRIVLDDIEPDVLKMILGFLYTGTLKIADQSRLDALLATAKDWRLDDLQNLCNDLIRRNQAGNESTIVTLLADNL